MFISISIVLSLVVAQLPEMDVCVSRLTQGSELIDAHVAPSSNGPFFVLAKSGVLSRFFRTNSVLQPVLDISSQVRNSGEMGALSFAFHPRFQTNSLFYVLYIRTGDSNTIVSEFKMADGSASAERIVLNIAMDRAFGNHKGGTLVFSPLDGFLYVALGDGGDSNDTPDTGQSPTSLFGKILRIDVNGRASGKPYAVPANNPFVSDSSFLPEIFAMGLRNPFRVRFHPNGRHLYIGDVGQNAWEEIGVIDTISAVQRRGVNEGWPIFEGFACNTRAYANLPSKRDTVNATICTARRPQMNAPTFVYRNNGGASVMGGVVYRGSDPRLSDHYVFADFQRCVGFSGGSFGTSICGTPNLLALEPRTDGLHTCPTPCPLESTSATAAQFNFVRSLRIRSRPLTPAVTFSGQIWGFSEDERGELLIVSPSGIWTVVAPSLCGITGVPAPAPKPAPMPPAMPLPPGLPLAEIPTLCGEVSAGPDAAAPTVATLRVTLTVGVSTVSTPAFSVRTRTYNGIVPGPTIAVTRGTKLLVKVINTLGAETAASLEGGGGMDATNRFHRPNTTNLHVHGLHVSSSGRADNVSVMIEPGAEHEYEYDIHFDHPTGTFWYHPHFHGSTALQMDGGMAGAIVVLDDPAEIDANPPREHVLMLQHFGFGGNPKANLMAIAAASASALPQSASNMARRDSYVLVNGQLNPILTLARNEPRRLRVVNGNGALFVRLGFATPATCNMTVLAMDGIYHAAPASVTRLSIPAGGRACIVVQCSAAGDHELRSWALDDVDKLTLSNAATFVGTLLTARVADLAFAGSARVPQRLPPLPSYLAGVAAAVAATRQEFQFSSALMSINGARFDHKAAPLANLSLGRAHEWVVSSDDSENHPLHWHINHVLIVNMTMPQSQSTMFVGQWRDTVPASDAGRLVVRMVPHRFAGEMRGHCHLSADGDLGMMTFAFIGDADGVGASQASSPRGVDAAERARAAMRAGLCAAAMAATPASVAATAATTTRSAASGAQPTCGDGVVEAPEQCEPSQGGCCSTSTCTLSKRGAVCRPLGVNTPCDVEDVCDGVSAVCADRKLPLGQNCTNGASSSVTDRQCAKVLSCDGVTGFCDANEPSSFGSSAVTPCDDKDDCTTGDACNIYGECRGTFTCRCERDADCAARAPRCTVAVCNLATKTCTSTPLGEGVLCDDGQPCTADDRCSAAGVCAGRNVCAGGCSEPNGRCCAGTCVCDARFSGPTCAVEVAACAVGDVGCECGDEFTCSDARAVCDCSAASTCTTAKPLCRIIVPSVAGSLQAHVALVAALAMAGTL